MSKWFLQPQAWRWALPALVWQQRAFSQRPTSAHGIPHDASALHPRFVGARGSGPSSVWKNNVLDISTWSPRYLMFFCASSFALFAWSRAISSSLISASNFFLTRNSSDLALVSESKVAWMLSMVCWWTLRWFSNSSSFSAILFSISARICETSIWQRRALLSSDSRAASASSNPRWSSSFSISRRRRFLERAWVARPPSESCSVRSRASSLRDLFSRRSPSTWSARVSCCPRSLWASPESWRASRWAPSNSR